MKIFSFVVLLLLFGSCERSTLKRENHALALDQIGSYRRDISTDSHEANTFFNQGLALYYAKQYKEAAASFDLSINYDPQCAICYFGKALSLESIDPEASASALSLAKSVSEEAAPSEHGLIEVKDILYLEEDNQLLSRRYSQYMEKLYNRFPKDPDIAALYIDSLMKVQTKEYWTKGGEPLGITNEVKAILENQLAANPDHLQLNRQLIDLMKNSVNAKQALGAVNRLENLPLADLPEFLQAPSIIYLNLGRYAKASLANKEAIKALEKLIDEGKLQSAPEAFKAQDELLYSLVMQGKKREAYSLLKQLNDPISTTLTYLEFQDWEAIKKIPKPEGNLYQKVVWEFAQAIANLNRGDVHEAMIQRDNLILLLKNPDLRNDPSSDDYSLDKAKIALLTLEGEIASNQGEENLMKKRFEEAIDLDSKLQNRTPGLQISPRLYYGSSLLCASKPFLAEIRFLEDLEITPMNGKALYGLMQSYLQQGNLHSAHEIERHFEEVWKEADVTLESGCPAIYEKEAEEK